MSLKRWRTLFIKVRQRFSDISLYCLKLDELLLKFVKCFSDISRHCGKLGEFLLKSLKRWRTLIRIHQAYHNED
jgi:hypothetical protein